MESLEITEIKKKLLEKKCDLILFYRESLEHENFARASLLKAKIQIIDEILSEII
jgi:hypothetical protein